MAFDLATIAKGGGAALALHSVPARGADGVRCVISTAGAPSRSWWTLSVMQGM